MRLPTVGPYRLCYSIYCETFCRRSARHIMTLLLLLLLFHYSLRHRGSTHYTTQKLCIS